MTWPRAKAQAQGAEPEARGQRARAGLDAVKSLLFFGFPFICFRNLEVVDRLLVTSPVAGPRKEHHYVPALGSAKTAVSSLLW